MWKSSVLGQVLYGSIVYERVIIVKYANISLLVPQFLIAAELQSLQGKFNKILFLLQLDAYLIEGEPYNRLARKNKRRQNVARQNSNISDLWETGFKTPQDEQRQCGARSGVLNTQIF